MCLPSSGQSGISRRCRRQLLANTATSTRFASAAGSSRGFALDEDQALHVLSEWNARCDPPWSPAELLEKLHRAARYGREPVGGLL